MRSLNCEHTVYECKRAFFKTRSVQSMGIAQGLGISQQAFCNAKMAFVYTAALLAIVVLGMECAYIISLFSETLLILNCRIIL